MTKKVAYISGTRADFGLMSFLLHELEQDPHISLQVYATGMHLLPKFGNTVKEVRKEFPTTITLPAMITTDKRNSTIDFIGKLLHHVSIAFNKNRPDLVLTLGDRPEMLAVAMACVYLGIPSAQFHGGDKTGTVDEVARHAITKLSHLHFPATALSAKRIIAMGEEPWRVHVVGAPSLDFIYNHPLPTREEVYAFLNFPIDASYFIVLQHPVSEEIQEAAAQMKQTLSAVLSFKQPVVIIFPNTDPGGQAMIRIIQTEKKNPLVRMFSSLHYEMFLGMQKYCSVLVGNSSSGMIESSSFKIPVVNIGTRQQGRQHGSNVVSIGYKKNEIIKAIEYVSCDASFRRKINNGKNPWGDGHTADRVLNVLEGISDTELLLHKQITY